MSDRAFDPAALGERLDEAIAERVDPEAAGTRLVGAVFGDHTGLAVFVASLLFFALYWRVGIFSTDSYTVANSLVAVGDGHLHVERIVYGPQGKVAPGLHAVDGKRYGRNYGQVLAAVPVLWALQGLSIVVDLRLAFVGAWCLGVGGLVAFVGARAGRRRLGTRVGLTAALALYLVNLPVATALPEGMLPVLALQTVTAVGAGLIAVCLYRLGTRIHGRRVGVFAGLVTALATPVGFWATLFKRHTLTALLVVAAVYALYRSRAAPTGREATRFRALAYAPVGLATWIHAAEGLILFLALGVVDLATARSNRLRDLAVVGAAFGLALLPFFLTNAAISGDPLRPPRLLPAARAGLLGSLIPGGRSSGTATAIGLLAGLVPAVAGVAAGAVAGVVDALRTLVDYFGESLRGTDPDDLVEVFVRSGYVDELRVGRDYAINLSVLESMPVLGALLAAPGTVAGGIRRGRPFLRSEPARALDLFVVVYVPLHVLLFMSRLPTHHMYTVRYFHPVYPLGVYALIRVGVVHRAVEGAFRTLAGSYLAGVVAGGSLYLVALSAVDATLSEAVQLYALVALALAGAVGVWAVATTALGDRRRIGAALLGLTAGVTTVYLLASGLVLFTFTDDYLLPLSRVVHDWLRAVNPFPGVTV